MNSDGIAADRLFFLLCVKRCGAGLFVIVVDATTRASDAWQKRFHERFTQTHTHTMFKVHLRTLVQLLGLSTNQKLWLNLMQIAFESVL